MKKDRMRLGRYLTLAAVALAVIAQSLIGAIPAHAQGVQSPGYFDRNAVIQRAKTWTNVGVPYSQTDWLRNYRTDCSGFVSMAWGLDRSYVTWSLPEVAKPITKAELQPGDILLQQNHVIMFGGWADSQHTRYTVYEQVGGPIHRAIKRVIPYPYDSNPGAYKPYRYTGGHNLKSPGSTLPSAFMATYAGGGQVEVPGPKAAAVNASIQKVALTRGRQLVKQQQAQAQRLAAVKAKADAKAKAEAQGRATAEAAARHAAAQARADAKARAEAAKQPAVMQFFGGLLMWLSH